MGPDERYYNTSQTHCEEGKTTQFSRHSDFNPLILKLNSIENGMPRQKDSKKLGVFPKNSVSWKNSCCFRYNPLMMSQAGNKMQKNLQLKHKVSTGILLGSTADFRSNSVLEKALQLAGNAEKR